MIGALAAAAAPQAAAQEGFWRDFFTSAGFGGVAALLAAFIAAALAWWRFRTERSDAFVTAERERWWQVLYWVWNNQIELDYDGTVDALTSLEPAATTNQQLAMLKVVTRTALGIDGDESP